MGRPPSKEWKAGASAHAYQVGASGMPVAYRTSAKLHEAVYAIIRDRSLPVAVRARFKLALDSGNISWELDAFGNVRMTAKGSNAFPTDVTVNLRLRD
jgi:hypothetical protein